MLNAKPNSRDGAIAEVMRRATVDREFREWLLKDPNAALAEVFGRPVPSHIRIRCIEKDPDVNAVIVLPPFQPDEGTPKTRSALSLGLSGSMGIRDVG
jgi:hypothetical protein